MKIVLIAGELMDKKSSVNNLSPIIYADLNFASGDKFVFVSNCSERAIYAITEGVVVDSKFRAALASSLETKQ